MKHKSSDWPDDPVIEEIRAIRRKLWKEAGGTVQGYIRLIQNLAREAPAAKQVQKRKPRGKGRTRMARKGRHHRA